MAAQGRLDDGREIAVKKLSRGSRQGAREFMNEAVLLSRVQHKNVVNLYGYCTAAAAPGADGHGEKLLVYEYVANESLDKFLFRTSPPPSPSFLHILCAAACPEGRRRRLAGQGTPSARPNRAFSIYSENDAASPSDLVFSVHFFLRH